MKKFIISAVLLLFTAGSFIPAVFAGVPWENPQMIYTYVPAGNNYSALMKEAFAFWTKSTNSKILFKYTTDQSKAMIKVRFVKDAAKSSNMEHAIGVTYPKYKQTCTGTVCSVYMYHADIDIATNIPNGALMKKEAIYKTMVHEIGHALGLEHSTNPMSIMYYSKGSRNQIVTDSDFKTLAKLYGW